MDNEIDRKIDVTAILILLVQNRQPTRDWTLIGSGASGLGIQEWQNCLHKTRFPITGFRNLVSQTGFPKPGFRNRNSETGFHYDTLSSVSGSEVSSFVGNPVCLMLKVEQTKLLSKFNIIYQAEIRRNIYRII